MTTIAFIGWGTRLTPEMFIVPGLGVECSLVALRKGNDVFVEFDREIEEPICQQLIDGVMLQAIQSGQSVSDLREPYVVVK